MDYKSNKGKLNDKASSKNIENAFTALGRPRFLKQDTKDTNYKGKG